MRGRNPDAAGGQLAYSIAFRGQPVLEWSNLGLLLEGASALGPAVRIETSQQSSQDETWKPVHGKTSPIRNQYNAVAVQTVETGQPARRLVVEARAYDDGVAFRYVVPEQPGVQEMRKWRVIHWAPSFELPGLPPYLSLFSLGECFVQ